jgi:hypothetical protein
MKYTISGTLIFSEYKDAKEVFDLLKKHQNKFTVLNLDGDTAFQEASSLQLIESDHELPMSQRKGSVLLEKLSDKAVEILAER